MGSKTKSSAGTRIWGAIFATCDVLSYVDAIGLIIEIGSVAVRKNRSGIQARCRPHNQLCIWDKRHRNAAGDSTGST